MFKEISQLMSSPLRIKILTFFLRREGSWGTATEVASTLSAPRTQVQKELSVLARIGIFKSRKSKRTVSYSVNDKHELVVPLRNFVASACIPSDKALAQVFRKERGVTLVVASGFLVTGSKSPIELLIVSKKPDVKQIEKAVKKLKHSPRSRCDTLFLRLDPMKKGASRMTASFGMFLNILTVLFLRKRGKRAFSGLFLGRVDYPQNLYRNCPRVVPFTIGKLGPLKPKLSVV